MLPEKNAFSGVARLRQINADFNSLNECWERYQVVVFNMFCAAMRAAEFRDIEGETLVMAPRGSGITCTEAGPFLWAAK